jgi:hypothetical protein
MREALFHKWDPLSRVARASRAISASRGYQSSPIVEKAAAILDYLSAPESFTRH